MYYGSTPRDRSVYYPSNQEKTLYKERCPPKQKSRGERLKAKAEHLLTYVTVGNGCQSPGNTCHLQPGTPPPDVPCKTEDPQRHEVCYRYNLLPPDCACLGFRIGFRISQDGILGVLNPSSSSLAEAAISFVTDHNKNGHQHIDCLERSERESDEPLGCLLSRLPAAAHLPSVRVLSLGAAARVVSSAGG